MSDKTFSNKLLNDRIPFPCDREAAASNEVRAAAKQQRLHEFSIRFKEIFRGFNNAETARRLETTDAVIKNYTEGKRFPNDDLLLAITRATGVNLHWLLTGEGSRRAAPVQNVFTTDQTARIERLANAHGRTFDEEVRALAMAAVGFLEKIG